MIHHEGYEGPEANAGQMVAGFMAPHIPVVLFALFVVGMAVHDQGRLAAQEEADHA